MRMIAYSIDSICGKAYIVNMKQIIFFQMLSDETRLRALALVMGEGELCICELVAALGVAQPKVSRHMAAMRSAGIVTARRHAQWVFHSISNDLPEWKNQVLVAAINAIAGEAVIRRDKERLSAMKNRPQRCLPA